MNIKVYSIILSNRNIAFVLCLKEDIAVFDTINEAYEYGSVLTSYENPTYKESYYNEFYGNIEVLTLEEWNQKVSTLLEADSLLEYLC